MIGLGKICKNCTSLRAWSMIGARGDVGLRLKISRRRYNCVFRCSVWAYTSNYVYRMLHSCCFVLSYFFCSTMHNFRNSYYIGSFIHTHLMRYLFLSWVFWSRGSLWKQPFYP
ncbi:hypothetical protein Hanom_Chr16g01440761 [Helianthus anomalus]